MLELPEALTIESELNEIINGKKIVKVITEYTPHKFAWYYGDPKEYEAKLIDKAVHCAKSYGSLVEIEVGDMLLLFGDGVALRYHKDGDKRPAKHQLLIEFNDGTALSGSVQMYGGLWCFKNCEFDNPYYLVAKAKPSPLSDEFNMEYFNKIFEVEGVSKLSVKALLATEQRIPGLGNGVLQDILYCAKIHPRKKVNTLSDKEKENLYNSIKSVLSEMVQCGGRDTEKDLFGQLGSYKTKLSKNTVDKPCNICGTIIKKENYLGGSIYFCENCQEKIILNG